MIKHIAVLSAACLALAACASSQPRVIRAAAGAPDIHLVTGMATQVEMPDGAHVQSVVVGNPALVTAERADDVVNLVPKGTSGETNMIVRAKDDSGDVNVYQYHLYVADH